MLFRSRWFCSPAGTCRLRFTTTTTGDISIVFAASPLLCGPSSSQPPPASYPSLICVSPAPPLVPGANPLLAVAAAAEGVPAWLRPERLTDRTEPVVPLAATPPWEGSTPVGMASVTTSLMRSSVSEGPRCLTVPAAVEALLVPGVCLPHSPPPQALRSAVGSSQRLRMFPPASAGVASSPVNQCTSTLGYEGIEQGLKLTSVHKGCQ